MFTYLCCARSARDLQLFASQASTSRLVLFLFPHFVRFFGDFWCCFSFFGQFYLGLSYSGTLCCTLFTMAPINGSPVTTPWRSPDKSSGSFLYLFGSLFRVKREPFSYHADNCYNRCNFVICFFDEFLDRERECYRQWNKWLSKTRSERP